MKYKTNMTLSEAMFGRAWRNGINRTIINLVYCAVSVHVCVSANRRGFYCPVTSQNAPMRQGNPKKEVSCEFFIVQFIRKMSAFRKESTL